MWAAQYRQMLLTHCAVCAVPLGLALGKKCGRCSTRYCGPECQKQHWDEGGHDKRCKKIKKGGGAEQYHADKKCTEAVAAAAVACAEDTKGQKCYICLEAAHPRKGEGLVRGCACGDRDGVSSPELGVAHVSCLAEQAKILCDEAEENKLGIKVRNEQWKRWYQCGLCGQWHHGVVYCALGWACWKTYLSRPEADWARMKSITELGSGLFSANHHEDALSVKEAELAMRRRVGSSEHNILVVQANLANTYYLVGRLDQALSINRDVYCVRVKIYGEAHKDTLISVINYANSLLSSKCFEEARSLLRKTTTVAQRVLGESNDLMIKMRLVYARALYDDRGATLDDLREAVTPLDETARIARRVLGPDHPVTSFVEMCLRKSRAALRAREGDDLSSVCEAVEAMTPGGV